MTHDCIPQFLTRDEIAEMLHVSHSTIYRMVERQEFPFYKVGNSLRFQLEDVLTYLQNCRIEPVTKAYEYPKKTK